MFELLLQADKALADGSLDQAERTYWQLIELDSQNAIAVAGLARVALERGDEKKAREFAAQALGIDPDSIAARRIIDTLTHAGPKVVDDPIVQQMLGAERLEALSHRRAAEAGDSREEASQGKSPRKTGATTSRGRTRPDQMQPMPAEPLRERRKAGRLAAAAAAAAAAREPVKARHQAHHAMPIGRRYFEPADLKASPGDEFSEAEMAAAIEAVDAVDESTLLPAKPRRAAPSADHQRGRQADLLGAVEATDPDESVALRLALVSEALELDAAESSAAHFDNEVTNLDDEANDSFEAAEAVASSSLHASPAAARGTRPTYIVDGDRDFDAAEAEAEAAVLAEAADGSTAESDEESAASLSAAAAADALAEAADAAETAAAAEAMKEVSIADAAAEVEVSSADAAAEPEPSVPARQPLKIDSGDEPSEAEAEAQALREALALVLNAEPPAGPDEGPGPEQPTAASARSRVRSVGAAASGRKTAPAGAAGGNSAEPGGEEPAEPGAAAATPDAAEPATEPQPRRGGIFRRIRHS